jgi:hypothetical protein
MIPVGRTTGICKESPGRSRGSGRIFPTCGPCPPPRPSPEQHLEARLLELEKTHRARLGLPTAMARAEAGHRIDRLLEVGLPVTLTGGRRRTLYCHQSVPK